ncbi:glutathione S-transferase family protein [Salinisphaera sp.]|uniref:glutathione S-transferase family protein n=1 Tax=Salinisphaera sp. TaxID=1914330 RepID=UPI000C67B4DC|nr:glutathione S-transferase family protein [Salinisphaera sp.]MBS62082.1 glutathione S-transferase [Salinisphaera sp.]
MNDFLILHHYDSSPYAEKVRLMLGLANASWSSMLSPVQPPRPNLDPLTGGYRRIPVAQVGADIFCDTALIGPELATMLNCPALDPANVDADAAALMEQAQKKAFFAAIGAVPTPRLLGTMLGMFGPIGAVKFIKDRIDLVKGGTVRAPKGDKARAVLNSLLDNLESRLEKHAWVGGDAPSVADFATYHPLWLYAACNRRPIEAGAKVEAWYQRVGEIGHGHREEITQERAFAAARDADPRPLPESVSDTPAPIGTTVEVAPSDYGRVPVTGMLAAVTEDRVILARDTDQFGLLHVHFPRDGYSVKPK